MKPWLALTLLAIASAASAQWTFPLPPVPKAPESYAPKDVPTLYGDVDQASAAKVIEAIHAANKEDTKRPIYFYMQSHGGSVNAGSAIISAMQASRRPVTTVAVGYCISMCAMAFEHGAKRLMLPHAFLMVHNAHGSLDGELTHMAGELALELQIWDRIEQYVAKRSGMRLSALRAHEADQWWLIADDAVALNMADAVVNLSDYPVPHGAE